MTTGWTGSHFAGIPAGDVGLLGTMAPSPVWEGADYFLVRGINSFSHAPFKDPALYEDGAPVAPPACQVKGCGVPPMEFCRTLKCPPLAAPFAGGCVGPDGPVKPLST